MLAPVVHTGGSLGTRVVLTGAGNGAPWEAVAVGGARQQCGVCVPHDHVLYGYKDLMTVFLL